MYKKIKLTSVMGHNLWLTHVTNSTPMLAGRPSMTWREIKLGQVLSGIHTWQKGKDQEKLVADFNRQIGFCTVEQDAEAVLLNERRVDGMIGLNGIEVFFQCPDQIINTFIAHSRPCCPFKVWITLTAFSRQKLVVVTSGSMQVYWIHLTNAL